jgi:hypothetical protein
MAGMIRVQKPRLWLLLIGAIVLMLGLKEMQGLVAAGPALALNGQPALLLFNSEEGCECVQVFYRQADSVIAEWPAAARADVPVHRILLEERPDLRRRYHIERAPTLVLLDTDGQEVWRDRGVASNPQVFRLEGCAQAIQALEMVTAP